MSDTIRSDKVTPEPIDWLWKADDRGRIPAGMITIVAGRPGEGKSTFECWLAAEVSKRGDTVLLANAEDPIANLVRPRLEAAGAVLKNIHLMPGLPVRLDSLERDSSGFDLLAGLIRGLGVKLCILDPIAAFIRPSIYQDQEVRTALTPISKLAEETGCAFVLIHHTNKGVSKNAHALDAIGGSAGGLAGAARAVYIFGKSPDDTNERILAPAKFNLGPELPALAFEMDSFDFILGKNEKQFALEVGRLIYLHAESKHTAREVLRPAAGDGEVPAEKRALAAEWLTGYLALGSQPANNVREDAANQGISYATLRRAADEIGILKARKGFGPGSSVHWALPDGHPALEEAAAELEGLDGLDLPEPTDDATGGDDE